jgi:hypothetical protein
VRCVQAARTEARERLRALEALAAQCDAFAAAMDFTFLLDPARELFTTGLQCGVRVLNAIVLNLQLYGENYLKKRLISISGKIW